MTDVLISHVGIAVADLEKAVGKYRVVTGTADPEIHEVADQKVKVAILDTSDSGEPSSGGRIELVTPTSDDSPVAKYLQKKGEGLHHICIYVDDIAARLAALKAAGVKLIDETPRVGAEGNLIAFVHPKDTNGVLIELEQKVTQ